MSGDQLEGQCLAGRGDSALAVLRGRVSRVSHGTGLGRGGCSRQEVVRQTIPISVCVGCIVHRVGVERVVRTIVVIVVVTEVTGSVSIVVGLI